MKSPITSNARFEGGGPHARFSRRAAAVRRVAPALPASVIGRAERAEGARAAAADVPALAIVGSWVSGSGIGQVVGDAIAQIDRQRRSVLWSDTAEMSDTGDVTGSDAAS